jgi:hypothetical protein
MNLLFYKNDFFKIIIIILCIIQPYVRSLFFDHALFKILFLISIIPIIPIILQKIIKKEFIKDNNIVIILLLLFYFWILIGALYSPSKYYLLQKTLNISILIFLFFSSVIISQRKLFIKLFINFSLFIICIAFLLKIISDMQGIVNYSMTFSRLCLLIYFLLILNPIFNNGKIHIVTLGFLSFSIFYFQSKGVLLSFIICNFYMFFIHQKEVQRYIYKHTKITVLLLLSLMTAVLCIDDKIVYRYRDLNLSLLKSIVSDDYILLYGNLQNYYFDGKNGLSVAGENFFIHRYFPLNAFKTKTVCIRTKVVTNNTQISCLIFDGKTDSTSNPHVYCGKEHILTSCHALSDKTVRIDTRFINTCYTTPHIQTTIKEIEVTDGTHDKGKILFKKDFTKNQKTSLLIYTSKDITFLDRVLYLSNSLNLMSDNIMNFFVGYGTSSYPVLSFNKDIRSYPHNFILELIVENGLIGFVLYSFFLFYCFFKVKRECRPLFLSFIIIDLFSSSYSEARFLFFFLGFYILKHASTSDNLNSHGRKVDL